jgi:DNA-binding HxlR family transcriptional regulator
MLSDINDFSKVSVYDDHNDHIRARDVAIEKVMFYLSHIDEKLTASIIEHIKNHTSDHIDEIDKQRKQEHENILKKQLQYEEEKHERRS